MPKKLSQAQIERYHRDGCLFPLDVMPKEQALGYASDLAAAERKHPEVINEYNRSNPHLVLPFLDEIVHHPVILDVVEDVIGEDILAWGSVLFVKEPDSAAHVSWHQDYTYMGLDPHDGVSVWLALSPSNEECGCMQMLPGTHLDGIRPHRDTFGENNILTRGQTIDDLDTSRALSLVLEPGQISLHHPRTIHGSQPNRSQHRRVGFTIQAYVPPYVRSVKSQGHAMLVRGHDPLGHHELLPRPAAEMEPHAVALRERVNSIRDEVLYEGAAQRGLY